MAVGVIKDGAFVECAGKGESVDLSTIEASISDLRNSVTTLEDSIETLTSALNEVKDRLPYYEEDITKMKAQIEALQAASHTAWSGTTAELNSVISSLADGTTVFTTDDE